MNRSVAVMRMHLVDRITLFVMPAAVLAAAFAISLSVWSVSPVHSRATGAASSVFVFVLVAAALAVTRGLPFALGMGASRRAFTLGTGLTGLVLAVIMSTVYIVLNRLEVATDGWGLKGRFFELSWFRGSSPWTLWLGFMVGFVTMFMIGALLAALWVRFDNALLYVGLPLLILLGGAAAWLLTWKHWWNHVGDWFGGLSPLTATGWLALASVLLAVASWAALRRVRAA